VSLNALLKYKFPKQPQTTACIVCNKKIIYIVPKYIVGYILNKIYLIIILKKCEVVHY